MTRHNESVSPQVTLRVAGRPVHERLAARVPELTRGILDRLVAELPFYQLLPREQLRGEVSDIVARSLRTLALLIRDRREATEAELVPQRESAARRAEEGVPLDAVLSAYHLGMTISWQEITTAAGPADLPDLQAALGVMLRLHQQITAAVSAAYVEERHVIDSQAHSGRRSVMAALAAGEPAEAIARQAGIRLAPRYVALTLLVGPHPDDARADAGAKVAARRRLRRLQAALDRFAGEPVPSAIEVAGGGLLLPEPAGGGWDELRALITGTGRELGVELTAAGCPTGRQDVPRALRQTADIVDLVARSHRPAGLYRLADVLLEYQLSRSSDAHPELAALLEPIAGRGGLLETLEEFLRTGLSRRRTAGALHVHPNTVDYRIRRIGQLTGLNPTRPNDLQLLGAALVARRVLEPR